MNPNSQDPQNGWGGQVPQPSAPQSPAGQPVFGQPQAASWPPAQPLAEQQPFGAQPSQPQPAVKYAPVPGVPQTDPSLVNPLAPPAPVRQSKKWLIIAVIFIAMTVVAVGGGVWALLNYFDQRDNVDAKVTTAVATAVKEQADEDAAAYLEKEKQPFRLFGGPDDYGSLSFQYPKTWSLHVATDASKGGTYAAYLNPVSVPPVNTNERYGLRVTIEEKDYDRVIETYKSLVSSGQLQATSFQLDAETTGTRLDGNFTKDIRGSAVVFKIRDKTVTLRTDAETFKPDFDTLIKTIEFNK